MLLVYYLATGELPTTEQGLAALVERPDDLPPGKDWVRLASEVPIDPWNNEYEYTLLHGGEELTFEIRGFGPDGIRSDDDLVSTFRVHQPYLEKTNQDAPQR